VEGEATMSWAKCLGDSHEIGSIGFNATHLGPYMNQISRSAEYHNIFQQKLNDLCQEHGDEVRVIVGFYDDRITVSLFDRSVAPSISYRLEINPFNNTDDVRDCEFCVSLKINDQEQFELFVSVINTVIQLATKRIEEVWREDPETEELIKNNNILGSPRTVSYPEDGLSFYIY
jgi:hypothetical protein